ncbi:Uncharacterized protein HZ326_14858 [Fusarium oxysporum f. sp. albedinis]|nr:Uncharacterized protein HZ326_14858 [Fusarium oxysporum f. sp. albedinis]
MTLEAHVCRERQGLVVRAADKLFFLPRYFLDAQNSRKSVLPGNLMQAGLYLSSKSPQLTWVFRFSPGQQFAVLRMTQRQRKLADIFGEAVQEKRSSSFLYPKMGL